MYQEYILINYRLHGKLNGGFVDVSLAIFYFLSLRNALTMVIVMLASWYTKVNSRGTPTTCSLHLDSRSRFTLINIWAVCVKVILIDINARINTNLPLSNASVLYLYKDVLNLIWRIYGSICFCDWERTRLQFKKILNNCLTNKYNNFERKKSNALEICPENLTNF